MAPPGFRDLRAFLAALEARGLLVAVDAEVDPDLEIAEIHRRVIAAGGPALLFRRVRGSPWPLVTNLFGTKERVDLAFGDRGRAFLARVAAAPHRLMPPTPRRLWAERGLFASLVNVGMKTVRRAPVRAACDRPARLGDLPLIKSWAEDGGRFVTLPLVFTRQPADGSHNLGMYRMQRYDDGAMGLHMQIGKGGGFHYAAAEARGDALPVSVFLGGPPALVAAAIAPLPENVPELLLASLLLGEKLRLADDPYGAAPLAADAEFVLVGEARPGERRLEGPFGDHYGYYSLAHDYPVFRCSHVWRREAPILPATVVGKPRQEDFFLGDFLQETLSPLFPLVMPAVEDLWSYGETGYHALSAAVVKERYGREALASAFRILGEGQLSLTKFLLLLDRRLDLRDFKAVLEHVLARADFRTDLYVFSNTSMDTLDYAGPKVNEGSKGVLIGVGPPRRELPRAFRGRAPASVADVRVFCGGALVVQGPAYADDAKSAERLAADPAFAEWPLVVLVDDAAQAARSAVNFLWTTFTRFEPAADLHARAKTLVRCQASFEPPVLIDARRKPWYPAELFCDPRTAETVDRRWREYFPRGQAMGDSARAHLD
ncbi:MAG TPA: UbiD family decarboxylase [Planctomycetota bacterium]|nr:UbiD family decarboxylase [Planctomycetota bacterium]